MFYPLSRAKLFLSGSLLIAFAAVSSSCNDPLNFSHQSTGSLTGATFRITLNNEASCATYPSGSAESSVCLECFNRVVKANCPTPDLCSVDSAGLDSLVKTCVSTGTLLPGGVVNTVDEGKLDGNLGAGGGGTSQEDVSAKKSGALDLGFFTTGFRRFGFVSPPYQKVSRIVRQLDGKSVIGGTVCVDKDSAMCDVFVARLNTDNSLDSDFGYKGVVVFDVGKDIMGLDAPSKDSFVGFEMQLEDAPGTGVSFIVLADKRVGATAEFVLFRLNSSGVIDPDFAQGDTVNQAYQSFSVSNAPVSQPGDLSLSLWEKSLFVSYTNMEVDGVRRQYLLPYSLSFGQPIAIDKSWFAKPYGVVGTKLAIPLQFFAPFEVTAPIPTLKVVRPFSSDLYFSAGCFTQILGLYKVSTNFWVARIKKKSATPSYEEFKTNQPGCANMAFSYFSSVFLVDSTSAKDKVSFVYFQNDASDIATNTTRVDFSVPVGIVVNRIVPSSKDVFVFWGVGTLNGQAQLIRFDLQNKAAQVYAAPAAAAGSSEGVDLDNSSGATPAYSVLENAVFSENGSDVSKPAVVGLDSDLKSVGTVVPQSFSLNNALKALSTDSQGRVLAVGNFGVRAGLKTWIPTNWLGRFLPSGELDPTFGDVVGDVKSGWTKWQSPGVISEDLSHVTIAPDGSIYVAGMATALLAVKIFISHFSADGALDVGFENGGTVVSFPVGDSGFSKLYSSSFIASLLVSPSSSIHVYAVVSSRDDKNGAIWIAKNTGPTREVEWTKLPSITSDGKSDYQVANSAILVQAGAKILIGGVAGDSSGDNLKRTPFSTMVKVDKVALDPSYGTKGGSLFSAPAQSLLGLAAIPQDESVLALFNGYTDKGDISSISLGELLFNGGLDLAFGTKGFAPFSISRKYYHDTPSSALAMQGKDKVLVLGLSAADDIGTKRLMYLERLSLPAARADFTFGTAGQMYFDLGNPTDTPASVIVSSDGAIYVGGNGGRQGFIAKFMP